MKMLNREQRYPSPRGRSEWDSPEMESHFQGHTEWQSGFQNGESSGAPRTPDPNASMQDRSELQANFVGKGPKGYRRTDERIQGEICEILSRHPDVDATDIEVSFADGVVTLAGTVPDRRMKQSAERSIEAVYGVEDVLNRIRIQTRQPERGSTASPTGASNRSGAV
jgi:hypothetical protein